MVTQLSATQIYPTTVFASVQPNMVGHVAEQLKSIRGITYFSPLIGRFDMLIELTSTEAPTGLRAR